MSRHSRAALLGAAALALAATTFATEHKGDKRAMKKPAFVVVAHMGGSLAVNLDRVASVFHLAGTPEKPGRLRLNLEDGGDKTLEGAAAETLGKALREGPQAGAFVWVSHMGGTLGIPVRSIQSVFSSGAGAALSVRINYAGDPQAKTVEGAEATAVWRALTE